MKTTIKLLALVAILGLSSCGSSKGVRHDGLFYKGQVIKSNGERKTKVFIFGREACIRKSKKMARRRAARRSPDRNPNYGTTHTGGARQRH